MGFFRELISDDNTINEKAFVGLLSFAMLVLTLFVDIVTGILGMNFPIHEFVFDGFLVITLGSFSVGSVDKWIQSKKAKNEEPVTNNEAEKKEEEMVG